MPRVEAPPEDKYVLGWRGQNHVPDIPIEVETPCRNEEVSGRRLRNGEVMDLWFGEGYGRNGKKKAYREAALLCWTVCAVDHPTEFAKCALYQATFQPKDGVWGGVIPSDAEMN